MWARRVDPTQRSARADHGFAAASGNQVDRDSGLAVQQPLCRHVVAFDKLRPGFEATVEGEFDGNPFLDARLVQKEIGYFLFEVERV